MLSVHDWHKGGDALLKPVCVLALLLAIHEDRSVLDGGPQGVLYVDSSL